MGRLGPLYRYKKHPDFRMFFYARDFLAIEHHCKEIKSCHGVH